MSDSWLKASHLMRDCTYQMFPLRIKSVEHPDHGRKYENKQAIEGFILAFDETEKEFVIKQGSTNHKLIRAQLGESPDKWVGQVVILFPVVGNWFNEKNLLGIRVFVDEKNPRPKIAAKDMGRPVAGHKVGTNQEREHE